MELLPKRLSQKSKDTSLDKVEEMVKFLQKLPTHEHTQEEINQAVEEYKI